MGWNAAQQAEQAQGEANAIMMQHYEWQKGMAKKAIEELQKDQALWDRVAPEIQERLTRYTTGTLTPTEQAARATGIVERAAPVVTATGAAINQQAAAATNTLSSNLGARGLARYAPGVTARGLADIETTRLGATGAATQQAMTASAQVQDEMAVRGLSDQLDRLGPRPSLAQGYNAASGLAAPQIRPAQPAGFDAGILAGMAGEGTLGQGLDELWSGLRGLFSKNPGVL